jgi:hypothetical protein
VCWEGSMRIRAALLETGLAQRIDDLVARLLA